MLNQMYRDDLKDKERQLLKQSMTFAIHERNKLPAPSDALRKMHLEAFRPSSSNVAMSPLDKFRRNQRKLVLTRAAVPSTLLHPIENIEKMEVRDAETGELAILTSATWNGKEGCLPLDKSTIISMGTGRLNLKSPSATSMTSFPRDNNDKNNRINGNYYGKEEDSFCHPLVAQFFRDGPLVIQNHRFWSSKTGNIEPPSSSGKRVETSIRNVTDPGDDGGEINKGSRSPSSSTLLRSAASMMAMKYTRPDTTAADAELFRILFRNGNNQPADLMSLDDNSSNYLGSEINWSTAVGNDVESWPELEMKYFYQLMELSKEQEDLVRRRHRFGPQCDLSLSNSFFFAKSVKLPTVELDVTNFENAVVASSSSDSKLSSNANKISQVSRASSFDSRRARTVHFADNRRVSHGIQSGRKESARILSRPVTSLNALEIVCRDIA